MALSFARPKVSDKSLIQKTKNTTTRTAVKGGNIVATIQSMTAVAESKLAHHKDEYIIIRNRDELRDYIDACIDDGTSAIDTETTGLNPLTVDLVGVCLYTPSKKACYVPVNHKSYVTGARTKDQLTEADIKAELERFDGHWIMHNSKYDIRVLRHTVGIDLECYWDTQLAGNCIDENESHRLKDLHLKYCDSTDTESLTFDKLFGGVTFDLVPINVAYLYASGDAIKTFELYEYQKKVLESADMKGPYNIFRNIEMPLVKVVCDMEDRGVCLDFERSKMLSEKYHKIKEERQKQADEALAMYKDKIDNYKMEHPNHKLSEPLSLTSPTQLAVLFYDILHLESPDKKAPRGTGEDILKHFAKGREKNLCEAILGIRNVDKLLGTYIDKMPAIVHTDGRIHCSYNQYGAKTGRFSSSEPNMQNIPSHNKEIRTMFKAQDGYMLVSGDYSQQEPRLTTHCSNDKKMTKAYMEGKDIYATIASLAFDKPYDECLEFRKDGTTNPQGKERRGQAKAIVLGITYGKGVPAIGEDLGVTTQKAQSIYDKVMDSFPQLESFMQTTQQLARDKGYVETVWGRRRHLPDMQLEPYEYSLIGNNPLNFDPLAFGATINTSIPENLKKDYNKRLQSAYGWQKKNQIIEEARNRGIRIKDNGKFIAQAERQCVNSVIQGSASDMAKLALIRINDDPVMKELDFHILIPVHDEIIGECPQENVEKVGERLTRLMIEASKDRVKIPMKVDVEVTKNWYLKEN